MFFLDELKAENLNTFEDLQKKARKFTRFLDKLKDSEVGKRQMTIIKQIEEKFAPFNDSLEFYIQESIGFDR